MKKIQNKMHTLGERIQEYGMRISSFYLYNSTPQPLNNSTFWCFHPHMVPQRGMAVYYPDMEVYSFIFFLFSLFQSFPVD